MTTRYVKAVVFMGGTGTGKTHTVAQLTKDVDVWHADLSTPWWNGYNGQTTILVDDLTVATSNLERLKMILSPHTTEYPVKHAKGIPVPTEPMTVYITTNEYLSALWSALTLCQVVEVHNVL